MVLTGMLDKLVEQDFRSAQEHSLKVAQSFISPNLSRIVLVTNESKRLLELSLERRSESLLDYQLLKNTPRGALATSLLGLQRLSNLNLPLIVAPGDTLVTPLVLSRIQNFIASDSPAGVFVFRDPSPEENWSFIHLDGKRERVLRVSEGGDSTGLATAGIFMFRNTTVLLNAAQWCFVNHAESRGSYFSSAALNYLISIGEELFWMEIPKSSFSKIRPSSERLLNGGV